MRFMNPANLAQSIAARNRQRDIAKAQAAGAEKPQGKEPAKGKEDGHGNGSN